MMRPQMASSFASGVHSCASVTRTAWRTSAGFTLWSTYKMLLNMPHRNRWFTHEIPWRCSICKCCQRVVGKYGKIIQWIRMLDFPLPGGLPEGTSHGFRERWPFSAWQHWICSLGGRRILWGYGHGCLCAPHGLCQRQTYSSKAYVDTTWLTENRRTSSRWGVVFSTCMTTEWKLSRFSTFDSKIRTHSIIGVHYQSGWWFGTSILFSHILGF